MHNKHYIKVIALSLVIAVLTSNNIYADDNISTISGNDNINNCTSEDNIDTIISGNSDDTVSIDTISKNNLTSNSTDDVSTVQSENEAAESSRCLDATDEPLTAEELKLESFGKNEYSNETIEGYPSTYTSKLYNLAPDDQGSDSSCWAFAFNGACESSLLRQCLVPKDQAACNPYNIAYNAFLNNSHDKYGLTSLDKSSTSSYYKNLGGNATLSTICMSTWRALSDKSTSAKSYIANKCHLEQTYNLTYTDENFISKAKSIIYNEGSIIFSVGFNQNYNETDNVINYINNNAAFYTSSNTIAANHEVEVIGWDDNYSTSNFGFGYSDSDKPIHPGAWLVRNSWGGTWGDNGYYWLSYYDSIFSIPYQAVGVKVGLVNDYDNITYDDGTTAQAKTTCTSIAHVFTSQENTESLQAISFLDSINNLTYTLKIYILGNNYIAPDDGIEVYSESGIRNMYNSSGLHTITLSSPIILTKGQTYSVVISANGLDEYYMASSRYSPYRYRYTESIKPNISYMKYSTNGDWYDTSKAGNNMRIHTFTNTLSSDSALSISGLSSDYVYTGSPIEPSLTVNNYYTDNGLNQRQSVYYYNNLNVGKVIGFVEYENNSALISFNIVQADIHSCSLVSHLSVSSFTDSPIISFTYNSISLHQGIDYELSYFRYANTKYTIITGINNYKGQKVIASSIIGNKQPQSDFSIVHVQKSTYRPGLLSTPSVTIKSTNGTILKLGKDYKLTYENNSKAGMGTVTAYGLSGTPYAQSVSSCSFRIKPVNINKASIRGISGLNNSTDVTPVELLSIAKDTMDPAVFIKQGDSKGYVKLAQGIDYETEVTFNKRMTKGYIKIKGANNYYGEALRTFRIYTSSNKVNINDSRVRVGYKISKNDFQGGSINTTLLNSSTTVSYDDKSLEQSKDYTILASKKYGQYQEFLIKGKGLYTGIKRIYIKISI